MKRRCSRAQRERTTARLGGYSAAASSGAAASNSSASSLLGSLLSTLDASSAVVRLLKKRKLQGGGRDEEEEEAEEEEDYEEEEIIGEGSDAGDDDEGGVDDAAAAAAAEQDASSSSDEAEGDGDDDDDEPPPPASVADHYSWRFHHANLASAATTRHFRDSDFVRRRNYGGGVSGGGLAVAHAFDVRVRDGLTTTAAAVSATAAPRSSLSLSLTDDVAAPAARPSPPVSDRLPASWSNALSTLKAPLPRVLGSPASPLRPTDLQALLLPTIGAYRDLLFGGRTAENAHELRRLYAAHVANHVLKNRGRVLKHSAKIDKAAKIERMRANAARSRKKARSLLARAAKTAKAKVANPNASAAEIAAAREEEALQTAALSALTEASADVDLDGDDKGAEEVRDQGFVRPTVLVLLPFRHSVFLFVKELITLLTPTTGAKRMSVPNLERFEEQYGEDEDDEEEAGGLDAAGNVKTLPPWRVAFPGNNDDCHQLGISFQKRGSRLKLFADFYDSDIIVASPLALKVMIATSNKGVEKGNVNESAAVDFLTSIEIVVADQCDSLLMQNWQHTLDVLAVLNRKPKKIHPSTDFSRVRHWALEGQDDRTGQVAARVGKFYRQFIAIGPFVDAEMRATFHKYAASMSGGVRITPAYVTDEDIMVKEDKVEEDDDAVALPGQVLCTAARVVVSVRQLWQRVPTSSLADSCEERMRFFVRRLLPQLINKNVSDGSNEPQKHTLVVIPECVWAACFSSLLLLLLSLSLSLSVLTHSTHSPRRRYSHFVLDTRTSYGFATCSPQSHRRAMRWDPSQSTLILATCEARAQRSMKAKKRSCSTASVSTTSAATRFAERGISFSSAYRAARSTTTSSSRSSTIRPVEMMRRALRPQLCRAPCSLRSTRRISSCASSASSVQRRCCAAQRSSFS